MRIALFCPSGPRHSPLIAYAQALAPILASEHKVTFVLGPAYTNDNEVPHLEGYSTISYGAWLAAPERFGLAFYQFGDRAGLHGYMFEALWRQPGVCVLHSTILHQALLADAALRFDPAFVRAELTAAYGPEGEALAQEVAAGREEGFRRWPLLPQVLERGLALIATQEGIAQEVARLCPPGVPIAYIPLPVEAGGEFPSLEGETPLLREAFSEKILIVAPFPPEAPQDAVLFRRAMEYVRHRWPHAIALVCDGERALADFAPSLIASKAVWWLTDLSPSRRRALLARARAAVFFAAPDGRFEAAGVAQALAYGIPTIIVGGCDDPVLRRATLSIPREHPQNWAILAAALDDILAYPEHFDALRAGGKRLALEHFGPERARRALGDLLAKVEQRQALPSPIWDEAHRDRVAIRESLSAVSGQALAELGLTPGDPLLRPIAEVIGGLVPAEHSPRETPLGRGAPLC